MFPGRALIYYFLLCKIKAAQGRGLEGHISLGLWDYNQNTQSWQVAHILDFMKKNCMQTCQVVIEKHSDDLCIMNTHHINPVLRNSILTGVHAACMHSACTPVKMKFLRVAFDWSGQVILISLPISVYFLLVLFYHPSVIVPEVTYTSSFTKTVFTIKLARSRAIFA